MMTRVQTSCTSGSRCDDSRMARRPWHVARSLSRMRAHADRVEAGQRFVERSTVGLRTRPQAMITFCRMPRDGSLGSDRSLPRVPSSSSGGCARAIVGHPMQPADQAQVLLYRRNTEQVGSSGMKASCRFACSGACTMSRPATSFIASGGRPENAGHRPQGCRFAGPFGPDESCHDFASLNRERQVVHSSDFSGQVRCSQLDRKSP